MVNSDDLAFLSILASSDTMVEVAQKMNVTAPAVSTKLQNLEKKIGIILVQRRVKGLHLTEIGSRLVEESRSILYELNNLNRSINSNDLNIKGKITIVGPVGFGEKKLAPLIANFIKIHPSVSVELKLSDKPKWSDCVNTDIMFYIGQLKDSGLIKIKISQNKRLLCTSPHYLKSNKIITSPSDLKQHRCISLQENDEDTCKWRFRNNNTQKITNIRITPYLTSNVSDVVKCWAINGLGIIQRSEWDVVEEINSGELVEILPGYSLPDADIVALLDTNMRNRPQNISAFINYAKEYFKN